MMQKYIVKNDSKLVNWPFLAKKLDKLAKASAIGILSIIAFEVLLALACYASGVN
jgi:hypothetical protein